MIFLCLEYLDIIVYLKNMHQFINATGYKYNYKLGISIMIGFLWISRFIGYRLADKLTKLHNNLNYTPSTTSLLIGLTFVMQALSLAWFNGILFIGTFMLIRVLYSYLVTKLLQQINAFLKYSLNYHDETIIYFLLGSLELGIFAVLMAYKLIFISELDNTNRALIMLLIVSLLWFIVGSIYQVCMCKNAPLSYSNKFIYKNHNLNLADKQILLSLFIVGIRSSLSVIAIIYIPAYLIRGLHYLPQYVNHLIMSFGLIACIMASILNYISNKLTTRINILVFIITIIITIASYACFFLNIKLFPSIAAILFLHSYFVLISPKLLKIILSTTNKQMLKILSCYRNGFFVYATLTFLIIKIS